MALFKATVWEHVLRNFESTFTPWFLIKTPVCVCVRVSLKKQLEKLCQFYLFFVDRTCTEQQWESIHSNASLHNLRKASVKSRENIQIYINIFYFYLAVRPFCAPWACLLFIHYFRCGRCIRNPAHCTDHFAKTELSKFLQNHWTNFDNFCHAESS